MTLVKMAGAVALATAMASGQSGCQAQQPTEFQPDPAPQQQVLDPVAPIPGDEWFAGYPMEPGMGEAVLCSDGEVVDYWPHQDWKKAKAAGECADGLRDINEFVERVNELDSTDSEWRHG